MQGNDLERHDEIKYLIDEVSLFTTITAIYNIGHDHVVLEVDHLMPA